MKERSADVARLDSLLRGPGSDAELPPGLGPVGEREDGGGGSSGGEDGEPPFSPFNSPVSTFAGNEILDGMDARAASVARGAELAGLVDKLVDQVLAGQRADGEQELRMTLKGGALAGAEVTMAMHDGALEVRIAPVSEAGDVLLRNEAANLSRTLAERLGHRVTVEVTPSGAGSGPGDDRRQGRSQGYDDILRYAAGEDR